MITEGVICDSTKLCVEYDGNGLNFNGAQINRVNYNNIDTRVFTTNYAHSGNIGDDGTVTGYAYTSPDTNTHTSTVTINGAESLTVDIYCHWWTGGQITFYIDGTNLVSQCYQTTASSNYGDWRKITRTITGNTVTFQYRMLSTNSFYTYSGIRQSYGYYAIVTGRSGSLERPVSSGEYATPSGTNAIFHGWSTTVTTPGAGTSDLVKYANEEAVTSESGVSGENGDTETLYAVWQQSQTITFTKDSNVSSIDIIDTNSDVVSTITASGQSANLWGGNTYFIRPTYAAGYAMNTATRTSGVGTVTKVGNGADFTVGVGSATINITSKKPSSTMQNYNCSNLAIGGTDVVYDTRDNTHYSIGKLADGRCWMLDNLALGSTSSITLTNSNTNISASSWTLPASTSDTFRDSFTTPMIDTAYKNNSVGLGIEQAGTGKIGVYYNYCAATAGTYCMAEDSETGNASNDICPKGWRLPTGGGSGEYKVLRDKYSSDAEFARALRPVKSGHRSSKSPSSVDSYGNIWSSTLYSTTIKAMSNLEVSYASVNTNNWIDGDRDDGLSIRCIRNS